jgi:Undecaprenyl-phosphate galactose phosphotransferase WbaP
VNDPAELEAIVRERAIRHAVVLLPDLPHRRLGEELNRYSRLVPHLLVLSDCSALPTLWSTARNGGRLSGIEVRNGLLLATLQGVKRAIDAAVILAAAPLVVPLVALAAALVKLGDGGSVFYGHTRIGRNGRPFRAWKFRTMRSDGDAILQDLLDRDLAAREQWERDRKLANDPRVTRFGRLLRITSLDELPQLWNVLTGDMSLVGPRPIVRDEVRRYGEVFPLYATVKPGITGLWQVSGRNDVGYEERVRLDEFYVRHWSPWLDVYILAKTLVALVSRRGAY